MRLAFNFCQLALPVLEMYMLARTATTFFLTFTPSSLSVEAIHVGYEGSLEGELGAI